MGSGNDLNFVWEARVASLDFQFGSITLGRVEFNALTLVSSPFSVEQKFEIPLDLALSNGCQAVVVQASLLDKDYLAIGIEHRALRYTARYYLRFVIDLKGSFSEYLATFSKKSRHELQRTVRRFSDASGGTLDVREYRTASEIMTFRDIAIAISSRSYKKDIGWGFEEGQSFAQQLQVEAGTGALCGYVLMLSGEPAAYGLCKIEKDIIVYKYTGYVDKFARRSPGKVLLYLMLERFFAEGRHTLFDFDGTDYFAYKEFFATQAIPCRRVIWFQPTIRNVAIGVSHWIITAAWRAASEVRRSLTLRTREWASARELAGLPNSGPS